ncbi:hypothetical protein A3D78_02105 [Candidatus Gottesmanbacteria bacterium RIFCSPHIGHO2_02_FULL_39_14]|uniref:Addiction module toxin RelE n=2 Tax=Candidatus Gottesmaniibacteriota TaxID=1752720 RepID=A0A1F6A286_9BACT|nr:MAG: hypothetical protein A2153_04765 [Candidatus Gottesmanbacteria bacterium RBG_16_38_7b]OGG18786.1 MAG: hypothetical protein A3D78_02105 [Candidatus Gottesmanbacteria bacterium RIFCSPHIGHO2_02_FULL_39_14]
MREDKKVQIGGWKIKYYTPRSRGVSPIYEFIESLSEKAQSKLINTFDILTQYGIQLREPHVKKVTGTTLWELRILGEDNIRIFYIATFQTTFLMLHAFQKKKQKTQRKEIKIALTRLKQYEDSISSQ